ncbi:uncharacterized protein LOC117097742, partial [Trachypithecus francoisi]|uniref:uncharacterized protein LOC117097742 n=1 Tax=Trachypithecus francoisi TaxID=54180 RepID=UPI00141B5936
PLLSSARSCQPSTGLVGLPQLQARCYTGSGTEHREHAQSVPICGRLFSSPFCFWKPLSLLPPWPCLPAHAPSPGLTQCGCIHWEGAALTAPLPTLLPVPAAPSCKAGGDFLLQGRNTSIMDTLDPKGTGASEQGGAIKGMPRPPPEPAQRSLGGREWPLVLHEGLMRGGQTRGGFPRKHRALRLSPPAQAVTRLDGSCSLAPSVQFPVPWEVTLPIGPWHALFS